MSKAVLGELQESEAVLGPPWSPCRAADLLHCRQTWHPQPSEPCQAELHMLPFCSYPGTYFLNTCFLLAASTDLKKKPHIYLFISFFLKKCGNQKAHSSQHTVTWPVLWDPAQPEPGCGHALNSTNPLAVPEAKAAFPSDTNYTQVQSPILTS